MQHAGGLFSFELINKNTREKKKKQMDPCEWRMIFFVVCLFVGLRIMKVAEAGPITGEICSPSREDAAGYKGLNKGDLLIVRHWIR